MTNGSRIVEIWAWSGCPSHERASADVIAALTEIGHPGLSVGLQWIETTEEAARLHFAGSPTIAVGGRDILPAPDGSHVGLTCRVYRRRDGRVSPVPDPDDLREALQTALREPE